jgi:nicotinate phosphoribosyltransferase
VIIRSILDTDLYKLTMQQAVWRLYPEAIVEYEFIERNRCSRFTKDCLEAIRREISAMADLSLARDEREWLAGTGWFSDNYLDWLSAYRFEPDQIDLRLEGDRLRLRVRGPWATSILWEVPLLAIISECYFALVETDWSSDSATYRQFTRKKGEGLVKAGCQYVDFGTRRRRSLQLHRATVEGLLEANGSGPGKLVGTSNLMLAREFDLKPVGTVAHEWIMAIGSDKGIRSANRISMEKWLEVYDGPGAIALTDTFTIDLFLKDFNEKLARSIGGVRQDSGDPLAFIERFVAHYRNLGIDPREKRFVFSDGLNVEKAARIQSAAEGKCQPSFGIGTFLTNDFPKCPALDIVIKLTRFNGRPAVKTGDDTDKATGEKEAIQRTKDLIFKHTGRNL